MALRAEDEIALDVALADNAAAAQVDAANVIHLAVQLLSGRTVDLHMPRH